MDELGPWRGSRTRPLWPDVLEVVLTLLFLASGAAAIGFLFLLSLLAQGAS